MDTNAAIEWWSTDSTAINKRCRELRAAANAALQRIKEEPCDGAINWADLRCVEAAFVVSDDGRKYYRVCIEEADPSAVALQQAVTKELVALGWANIEVRTEW